MPISINGTGTITGISAGGLPSGIVTGDTISNGSISTADIADGSITAPKLGYQNFSFRNRIINGDMRIDQRNAGASVTQTTGDLYPVDRFRITGNVTSKFTGQQSTVSPSGFCNSLLITSLATTSVSAGDYYSIDQKIEGFDVADFDWGTASAKTITLSFWTRSSLTGTFGGSVRNGTNTRSYPFTYTISAANTWEQKTVVIAGDTTGTWATDNSIGLSLRFGLGVGSTYSGSAGAWSGSNLLSATGAVSVVGTNGATFYLTGVQLEVGSTATDFERRTIGTELALCQRYYEVGNAWLQVTGAASSAGMSQQYSVTKRASATNAFTNITYNNGSNLLDFSSSIPAPVGTTALSFYFVPTAAAAAVRFTWSAAAEL